jgi:hypothetical protein
MGTVFYGVTPAGDEVAVKTIRDFWAERPALRSRFEREIEAMEMVQGPRVANLIAAAPPGPARSTALSQLATELPAALLARMLGIRIDVAVAWQRASAGDWTAYAADVSRRSSINPAPDTDLRP